jgi:MFS family permease
MSATGWRRNPWLVVLGAGLSNMFGLGPLVLGTFGLFVIPISHESGLSRTSITLAFTAAAVGMALGTLVVGRLLDVFALRVVVIPAWALYAAGVAGIAATPLAQPWFVLPYFLTGFFAGGTFIPMTKAIVSWFDNRRGLALAVMAVLAALGSTALPPLATMMIRSLGWRWAYLFLGVAALAVSLVTIVPFVRVRGEQSVRGRQARDTPARDAGLDLPGLSVREALATRQFWFITVILCVAGMAVFGIQVNTVPMLTDAGMPLSQAALLLTVYGITAIAGRLLGGPLLDRIPARLLIPVILLCPVGGLFLLRPTFSTAVTGMALIGLAFGVEVDFMSFLVTRYLGLRRFGTLVGAMHCVVLFSVAFGPAIVSAGRDRIGSYEGIMPYLGAALVGCALLAMFLGRYRYPAVPDFDRHAAEHEPEPSQTHSIA